MRFVLTTVLCLGLVGCETRERDGTVQPAIGAGDDLMAAPGLKQRRLDPCETGDGACQ